MTAVTAPQRIRLQRTAGWRITDHTANYVVVDRRSIWGNPWTVSAHGPEWIVRLGNAFPVLASRNTKAEAQAHAVDLFRRWLTDDNFAAGLPKLTATRDWILDHLHELAGKDLCCWCGDGTACHGDVLIEFAAEAAGGTP